MRVCDVLGLCVLAVVVSVVAAALPPLRGVEVAAPSSEEHLSSSYEAEEEDPGSYEAEEEDPDSHEVDEQDAGSSVYTSDPSTVPSTDSGLTSVYSTEPPSDPTTDQLTSKLTTESITDSSLTSSTMKDSTIITEPTHPPVPTPTPPRSYNITMGKSTVEGAILKSFKNRDFYGFMSLPYARPPVEDLRFKYPEPWGGSFEGDYYDATYLRARCAQGSLLFSGTVSGKEDCLHVSVYTPLLPEDLEEKPEALSVMVFIHGGAYMSGDAFLYVPTKLMDRDVVVVVVQYRLGLLGFLAGGKKDAPGNMGLMDQVEALRWVQKYIHHFGGNPDLVTVFGQSAGGASSSWMYLTPVTQKTADKNNGRQLLHRVIPQSGSALEEWTLDDDPEYSFDLALSTLGCKNAILGEMKCMRNKPFEDIVKASLSIYLDGRRKGELGFKGLCPVIQKGLPNGVEVVIPKDPRDILDAAEFLHIPAMSGSVRDEGSLVTGLTYKDYMVPNNHTVDDEDFLRNDAVPMLIKAFGIEDKTGSVANSMKMAFMPEAELGDWDSMVGGMIDMSGVMFLKSGLWEVMRRAYLAANETSTFFYSWEFEADDSLFEWIFMSFPDIPVPGGVSHADELLYLFHLPAVHDDRQQIMVDRMTKIWTNFAKYGDPTPDVVNDTRDAWEGEIEKWLPYNSLDRYFMLVQDNFTMELDFSTRWNYHTTNHSTGEPITTTPMPEMVSRDDYDNMKEAKENFQIATGIIGIVLACFVILFIVVYVRKRKMLEAMV